jgi:hypothetical protein
MFTGIASAERQTIQLDRLEFDIPSSLEWEDNQGTLVASFPGSQQVILRVSTNYITKDGAPVPRAGVNVITLRAKRLLIPLERHAETVWYRTEQPATDGNRNSVVYLWHVGFNAHGLVITCFVDGRALKSREAELLLSEVPAIIRSLREVPNKPLQATRKTRSLER